MLNNESKLNYPLNLGLLGKLPKDVLSHVYQFTDTRSNALIGEREKYLRRIMFAQLEREMRNHPVHDDYPSVMEHLADDLSEDALYNHRSMFEHVKYTKEEIDHHSGQYSEGQSRLNRMNERTLNEALNIALHPDQAVTIDAARVEARARLLKRLKVHQESGEKFHADMNYTFKDSYNNISSTHHLYK